MNYQSQAQRWHDTDHGRDRGRPLRRNQFRVPAPDPEPRNAGLCYCCCDDCDPDWSKRPNPYWGLVR